MSSSKTQSAKVFYVNPYMWVIIFAVFFYLLYVLRSVLMPFVAGIADGVGLNADEARAYADLASRDELIAQFVYVISSPLRGIASVCAGPARGLVTALDAIAEQKKEQEAA
jgi:ribosomal protein L10